MLTQIESYVIAAAALAVIVFFALSFRKPGMTDLSRLAMISSFWGLLLCGNYAEKLGKLSERQIGSHIYIVGCLILFLGLAYEGWKMSRKGAR